MERVQKVIAASGYCSRRDAEKLIIEGRVKINQKIAIIGDKANFDDTIYIDDKKIKAKEPFVYFLINKPRSTLSTVSDDRDRSVVVDLIKTKFRIYPVGRLDYETTGALLLTNDGELANKMMHPSNRIWKTYIVIAKGKMNEMHLRKLENGVIIDGNYKTAPAKVKYISYNKESDKTKIKLSIHEGKNRQVRKMIEAVGFRVSKLHRESFGDFSVQKIHTGKYIEFTEQQVKYLKD